MQPTAIMAPSQPRPRVIINSVIAYTRYLMQKDNKYTMLNIITAKFDLDELKAAYKELFLYYTPDAKFSYTGPKKPDYTLRVNDAFDKILQLLRTYDRDGKTPPIAFPVDGLSIFDDSPTATNDKRFSELERGMLEVRECMKQLVLHQSSNSDDVFPPPTSRRDATLSAVPPNLRARRSSSTSSVKRRHSSDGVDSNSGYEFQRHERRKMARRDNAKSSQSANPGPKLTSRAVPARKPAVWGKMESGAGDGFSGVAKEPFIPDIFLYRCAGSSQADKVKDYLVAHDFGVNTVELVSHKDSKFASFRVKVASRGDYDKLLTGESIPKGVGVKRFRYPRDNTFDHERKRSYGDQWKSASANLEALEAEMAQDDADVDKAIARSVTDNLLTSSQLSTVHAATSDQMTSNDVDK